MTNNRNSRTYVPTGSAESDRDLSAGMSAAMAFVAVFSVFAAAGLELHPLSRGWGYLFGVGLVFGTLGAIKHDTYYDEQHMYRMSSASWAAAGISMAFVLAGWVLLIVTDLTS